MKRAKPKSQLQTSKLNAKKSKKDDELTNIEDGITALQDQINKDAAARDDCALWGNLAAAQLRTLPEIDRLQVQLDFQKSFTEKWMMALKRRIDGAPPTDLPLPPELEPFQNSAGASSN